MIRKENGPGKGTGADEVLAGRLNDSILSDAPGDAAIILSPRNEYPSRIKLSQQAEKYLDGLAMDLVLGFAHYWQLSPALTQLWEFAYQQGRASRDAEIDQLEHEADRLYFEMTIRQPKPVAEYVSWADLQRRRQEHEAQAAGNYSGGDLKKAWGRDHD